MIEIISTVALVTIAAASVIVALELKQIIGLLHDRPQHQVARPLVIRSSEPSHELHRPSDCAGGIAVYVYRDESWHLEADFSTPGFETTPPTIPGRYSGQVVKKESTKRKSS